MKADAKTEKEIMAFLDRFAEAYSKRDSKGALALVAPDADVVLYGTGADEKRIGRVEIEAQMKRDWAQSEAASFKYEWTSISVADGIAWVATDATMKVKAGGQEQTFPARATMVLAKRGDRWLLVQAHFSVPVAGQAEGESWVT